MNVEMCCKSVEGEKSPPPPCRCGSLYHLRRQCSCGCGDGGGEEAPGLKMILRMLVMVMLMVDSDDLGYRVVRRVVLPRVRMLWIYC